MKRKHPPQLTEQKWLPQIIKDNINEFLTWFVSKVNATKPFVPVLQEIIDKTQKKTIYNVDLGLGAGIETFQEDLQPASEINIKNISVDEIKNQKDGIYVFVNCFHRFTPTEAKNHLQTIANAKNPVVVVEGNNDNWWQAIGMSVFVPLAVLLTAPFVKPFRISRLIFTYLIPILPIITSLDGILALFKLYGLDDLKELTDSITSPKYQWKYGKNPNGRGGKIIYLTGRNSGEI